MQFSKDELSYYSRQFMLNEINENGQLKLKNAKVLCIGAGGLGSPLLQYLAAAGIGTIGIIDHDVVEISNLSRQIIYKYNDIGEKKVIAAKRNLLQLNPFISINIYSERFDEINALSLINNYDIIADCTDNLINRYITNHVCVALNKSFAFAGIWRYQGQCMLFHGKKGACFNCLFPFTDASYHLPDCNNAGVLGVLPGMLGMMQANLIIQHILQISEVKVGTLFALNARALTIQSHTIERDRSCRVCSVSQNTNQVDLYHYSLQRTQSITLCELKSKIDGGEKFTLLDVRSEKEHAANNLGGILIPLPVLEKRLHELDQTFPIIVYCQSGQRSKIAATILKKNKFASVLTLDQQSIHD